MLDVSYFHTFRYFTAEKRRMASLLVAAAWLGALLVSLPMYIPYKGFSCLDCLNETSISNSTWACMPPVTLKHLLHSPVFYLCQVDPDCEAWGFVLYSSTLAFLLPSLALAALQLGVLHSYRHREIRRHLDRRFVSYSLFTNLHKYFQYI